MRQRPLNMKGVNPMKYIKINNVKANTQKTYRGFSKLNDMRTKFVHDIEVPISAKKTIEPYKYRSALYFDDRCGVKTKHIGCVIKELRQEYDLSRAAFADMATAKVKQYGIHISAANIATYEKSYYWKREGKLRNPCHPKADKMLGIVLATAALTGMSADAAFTALAGYTDVIHRIDKEA